MFGRSRADKTANAPLALHNIDDNLCFTGHEAWAWFVLPTQPWAFRSDRQREQLMHGVCDGLAWLAGYRLHPRDPYALLGIRPTPATPRTGRR